MPPPGQITGQHLSAGPSRVRGTRMATSRAILRPGPGHDSSGNPGWLAAFGG